MGFSCVRTYDGCEKSFDAFGRFPKRFVIALSLLIAAMNFGAVCVLFSAAVIIK
jgi:hypothetical protein